MVLLSCDTRRSRVDAVSGQDTVTVVRPAFVTIGSLQPANVDMLVLRELLVVEPGDSAEADAESDEFAAW